MKRHAIVAAAILFAACASYVGTSHAAVVVSGNPGLEQTTRSIWDGVYTEAQAERGKGLYLKECASCHAENLQGGDESPGLAGAGFLSQWIDLSVGDLFERIRISMPQDRPGQLGREAIADILAYLFKANSFPAGNTELVRDTAVLKQILIEPKPQQ
jgi:cytochrome c